jgi:hypothetical protein
MKKVVQPLLKTRIRSIDPNDFPFIQSLAAEFSTFTVPSEYVLWFFTRFHPEYCRVLEQESGGLRAYLLAMPTSHPENGIAIWQVAATKPNQAFALEHFASYLRDLADLTGATSVFFTTQQESLPSLRLIRTLAKLFNCDLEQLNSVPSGQGEYEFRISIGTACPDDENKKRAD